MRDFFDILSAITLDQIRLNHFASLKLFFLIRKRPAHRVANPAVDQPLHELNKNGTPYILG